MTSNIPQVIVTLTPQGDLAVELPGFMATRRKIILRPKDAGDSLIRILSGQAENRAEIGSDGAPTSAQVRHWERHGVWASASCRFCIAEGRAKPDRAKHRTSSKTLVYKRSDGIEVRRIKAGTKGSVVCNKTAKDLGL